MIRHLSLRWPDARPFRARHGRPIRILAVSDEPDHGVADPRNHGVVGNIDLIVGCGDLDPGYLDYLTSTFNAPLVYVRGNHDAGGGWHEGRHRVPEPLRDGHVHRECGIPLLGLSWPVSSARKRHRDERAAWRQVIGPGLRSLVPPRQPQIVISHVPPRDLGDVTTDLYHRGFRGYRWLVERMRPPLWLHGHTPLAGVDDWRSRWGGTTLLNVTGAVLLELHPPAAAGAARSTIAGSASDGEERGAHPPVHR